MGTISVVTVVKNGAGFLEETILSVIAQKAAAKIDYLIIDGGSTDGTIDIIRRYVDQIAFMVSEPDAGIYDAMNKGWLAAAEDSFILFLGAGDRLVSLPKDLDSYRYGDVVYGSVLMGDHSDFRPRADYHLNIYNSLHHQALLVNKALHPTQPFNCTYHVYADFDFNQRLKKNGAHFVFSPEFVSYAHPGGVSDQSHFVESLRIVFVNFGFLWAVVAVLGYYAMRMFPFLRFLRPVRERNL
jgi:glycosyltransferase involved in cell wall biosynthesis